MGLEESAEAGPDTTPDGQLQACMSWGTGFRYVPAYVSERVQAMNSSTSPAACRLPRHSHLRRVTGEADMDLSGKQKRERFGGKRERGGCSAERRRIAVRASGIRSSQAHLCWCARRAVHRERPGQSNPTGGKQGGHDPEAAHCTRGETSQGTRKSVQRLGARLTEEQRRLKNTCSVRK